MESQDKFARMSPPDFRRTFNIDTHVHFEGIEYRGVHLSSTRACDACTIQL